LGERVVRRGVVTGGGGGGRIEREGREGREVLMLGG
jgi:hypothetical protein